jgi:tRNA pseudouridine55 synthase
MKEVINVYKPAGATPFEIIEKLKENDFKYKDASMTYAGRLDPLAEGALVLLTGDAVHEKDKYLSFDKEYEAEILSGIRTDTFDILGLPHLSQDSPEISSNELDKFKGEFVFSLPPYSSFKIKGKPLFQWAREGRLDEIEIPKRKTKIYDIKLEGKDKIKSRKLLKEILDKIEKVKGDFRQEEIKKEWEKLLAEEKMFDVSKIKIFCSSGTYIRSIADKLGGALFSLKRTRVGDFKIADSIKIK